MFPYQNAGIKEMMHFTSTEIFEDPDVASLSEVKTSGLSAFLGCQRNMHF